VTTTTVPNDSDGLAHEPVCVPYHDASPVVWCCGGGGGGTVVVVLVVVVLVVVVVVVVGRAGAET
jgi:hypothetical protein